MPLVVHLLARGSITEAGGLPLLILAAWNQQSFPYYVVGAMHIRRGHDRFCAKVGKVPGR
jgi:hypothetical protein